MRRGFVRALWGVYDHQGNRLLQRRMKIDKDIDLLMHGKYEPPFVCYTFGTENHEFLLKRGFDSRLVDERPVVWDMNTQQFRHKLEVFLRASDDFDEFVFLDWDMMAVALIPADFWEVLGRKSSVQAILRFYHMRKTHWRINQDLRKVPCASFVYFRGSEAPKGLIEAWERLGGGQSEERALALYTDELGGGWQGIDYYWDHFEPDFFVLLQGKVYDEARLKTKRVCFDHFNWKDVEHELRQIANGSLRPWQRAEKRVIGS